MTVDAEAKQLVRRTNQLIQRHRQNAIDTAHEAFEVAPPARAQRLAHFWMSAGVNAGH